MPTEMEFVNYKEFVENLPEATEYASGDKSVASNENDGPRKFDVEKQNVLKFFVVVGNPEYLYAITDDGGKFLFGIKKDGSVDWQKGVPEPIQFKLDALRVVLDSLDAEKVDKEDGKSLIDSIFAEGVSVISNPEYAFAVVDSANKFLFGVKNDGTFDWSKGTPSFLVNYLSDKLIEKVNVVAGKSLIDEIYAATKSHQTNPEYSEVIADAEGRMLEARDKRGCHIFFTPPKFEGGLGLSDDNLTELEKDLKEHGFTSGQGDWSDAKEIQIPKPKCAILNFSGIDEMPVTKTQDLHGYVEFWDCNGNYFKKKTIINAQGTSSLVFPKKNISIDLCNDDWIGDDTFKLKIGKWVTQDSFHIKSYYIEYFRGVAVAAYTLYDDILKTRGPFKDRAWKIANVHEESVQSATGYGYNQPSDGFSRLDDGARCFPDGFPCRIYLNGVFYGLFEFQLKKHRDNYHMDKSNEKHIHLDGNLSIYGGFFSGNIDWTAFEIRNPKNLWCNDGSKYDGDNPKEIIDSVTAESWISSGELPDGTAITSKIAKQLRATGTVKASIVSLSLRNSAIESASTTEEKKSLFEEMFDVDNFIDYQIFSDVIHNVDGFSKNWQWCSWDGERWFVCAYDLDMAFGGAADGRTIYKPVQQHQHNYYGNPVNKVVTLYNDRLLARYSQLRNLGVIESGRIANLVGDIVKRFGLDWYDKEYEKWPDSPCNKDMVVNEDFWELVLDNDGNPVIATSNTNLYDPEHQYAVDDVCVGNSLTTARWFYTFKCKSACIGEAPANYFIRDSFWRLSKWCEENIGLMDNLYNYQGE